jgi:SAM-dependent methyltransferase
MQYKKPLLMSGFLMPDLRAVCDRTFTCHRDRLNLMFLIWHESRVMRQLYNQYVFPHILDRVMRVDSLTDARRQLLASVQGHVVEIGFGTGLNLPFYGPDVLSLTTVDPSEGNTKLADGRINQVDFPVMQKLLSAETLPFKDASVDAVVSTWTLCSIPNVEQALQEIRRILKPNGVFHFVEHALSPNDKTAMWQHRLTPIQKVVADGCHLDRDMVALIEAAGFTWIEKNGFDAAGVPKIGRYMVMGRAMPKV